MKHCILVKFKDKATLNRLDEIKAIFAECKTISGIYDLEYHTVCIDRENRYHLLIKIDMEKETLPIYDESLPHKKWKNDFGSLIEAKAIFDYE